MKVILTGGGTGGHLYPAIAIAEALQKKRLCHILFVGTRQGLEARVVPGLGYAFATVWISGLRRGRFFTNLLFPLKMGVSFIQSLFILLREKPDMVIGTGGYASWPVLAASKVLRIPMALQEQNQAPGLVTRLMAGSARRIYLSFDQSKAEFKQSSVLKVTGNPTRSSIRISKKGYDLFQLSPHKITIFIFGGSQGAYGINQEMLRILDRLLTRPDVQILWSTGPRWYEAVRSKVERYQNRVVVQSYIDDMGAAYGITDLLICRSGATTIAEVTRIGLPIIFIPFPGAAADHQTANATALVDAGAAKMVRESEFMEELLIETVRDLLDHPGERKKMAKNCLSFGRPDAADVIAGDILAMTTNN